MLNANRLFFGNTGFLLAILLPGVHFVTITKFHVPKIVNEGSDVRIVCDYKLEDVLWSVKWYRNEKEFYQYVPKYTPHTQVFKSGGVTVDLTQTDHGMVLLRQVDLSDSGTYKCEVSEDQPYFHTKRRQANMTVVALPNRNPKINGRKKSYHVGENVNLSCTTEKSKPDLKLTWYINDIQAPDIAVTELWTSKDHWDRRSPIVNLNLTVRQEHFVSGSMHMKCTAKVDRNYKRHSDSGLIRRYRKSSTIKLKRAIYVTDSSLTSRDSDGSKTTDSKCLLLMTATLLLMVSS